MVWTIGNSQFSPGVISGGAVATVTLTAPTGIVDGTLLHAAVALDIAAGGDPGAISLANAGTGAAWTKLSDHYTAAAFHGSLRLAVFRKIAASESGNYTASWTTAANAAWGIVAISGASTTTPVDQSAINSSATSVSTLVAPALTALAGSSDLEICTFANPGGGNPYTMPAAMTTIFNNGQPNTNSVFLGMSYQILTSNANTSTQSMAASGGDIFETSSVAYLSGGGGGGGGGSSPSIGNDSVAAASGANALLLLMRERASGLLEPVRQVFRPALGFVF